jgi:hypothetical protein
MRSGNHVNFRKGISKSIFQKMECWNCGKKGHLMKDCIAPKKQEMDNMRKIRKQM